MYLVCCGHVTKQEKRKHQSRIGTIKCVALGKGLFYGLIPGTITHNTHTFILGHIVKQIYYSG